MKLKVFFLLSLLPSIVNAADCNNNSVDDTLDLAVSDVTVGEFSSLALRGASLSSLSALSFSDVNFDGRLDVILAGTVNLSGQTNQPYMSLSTQVGTGFSETFNTTTSFLPTALKTKDHNNDEFLDVSYSNGTQEGVFFNQGNSAFVSQNVSALSGIPVTAFPASAALTTQAVDIGGDTQLDLLSVTNNKLEIFIRNSGGNLVLSKSVEHQLTGCSFALSSDKATEISPATDLNGDGKLDLVVYTYETCSPPFGTFRETKLTVLLNQGNGAFAEKALSISGKVRFLEFRDIRSSGVKDIVLSYDASTGCPGPIAFCSTIVASAGIGVVTLSPVRTSNDFNANNSPDECERAVPVDFDGDRKGDLTVVRDVNGLLTWISRKSTGSSSNPIVTPFGLARYDTPYAGDFNGDSRFEPTIVRDAGAEIPGLFGLWWFHSEANSAVTAYQYGLSGDTPVTGYFDTDNKTDRAVVRNQGGQLVWYINSSKGDVINPIPWGLAGDSIYSANLTAIKNIGSSQYQGDSRHELIVARNLFGGIYWFIRSLDGTFSVAVQWGLQGDTPIPPADYDGDSRADLAVARKVGSLLTFYIRLATGESRVVNFGLANDIPSFFHGAGDLAEPSVLRPASISIRLDEASHYQRAVSGLNRHAKWGFSGDWYLRGDGLGIKP